MPFRDNSFDKIISYTGVPNYLHSEEELAKSLGEIIRVLRSKGEFRAFPAVYTKVLKVESNHESTTDQYNDKFQEINLLNSDGRPTAVLKRLQERFKNQAKIEVVPFISKGRLIIEKN